VSRLPTLMLALTFIVSGAAHAIKNGSADGNAHPYVGELLLYAPAEIDSRFTDPGAWFSCSGTLISPTVVVTAGHCVTGVGRYGAATADCTSGTDLNCGNDMWINFSEEPDFSAFPASVDYIPDNNAQRYVDRAAFLNNPANGWVHATVYAHPQFADGPFYLHDLGVLVLDSPVAMATYGQLPTLGFLDQFFAQRRNSTRFTPVGYGLTRSLPVLVEGGDTRELGSVMLVSLNALGIPPGTVVLFSNNGGTTHSGGTCYGDSGGPVLFGDTNLLVAVTSFGIPPNCTGADGAYRIDQADDLDFIGQFTGP
jgi:hypothetical protein